MMMVYACKVTKNMPDVEYQSRKMEIWEEGKALTLNDIRKTWSYKNVVIV